MLRIEKTIFLSYRRTNAPWALLMYRYLTQHGFDVFFDFKGIGSGDFERVILENIKARAHFLVLLTPSALERCTDPADWLRREIETALENQRNIVPLMLEGFSFGLPGIDGQLTGALARLRHYNGLAVVAEYFDAAMERLCQHYLNVPLDAVLHPASSFAQQVALEQKAAADTAPPVTEQELARQSERRASLDKARPKLPDEASAPNLGQAPSNQKHSSNTPLVDDRTDKWPAFQFLRRVHQVVSFKRMWIGVAGSSVIAILVAWTVFKTSELAQLAVTEAQKNSEVVRKLGVPLSRGWTKLSGLNLPGLSSYTGLKVPVSGTVGHGTLYLKAHKSSDHWTFSIFQLGMDGDKNPVDLLKPPRPIEPTPTTISPPTTKPPRIYLKYGSKADSQRANAIASALAEAGYKFVNTAYALQGSPTKATDIRFYHEAERTEARKIASVLVNAGEQGVDLKYLSQFEQTTKARPNHFEIWLMRQAK